MLAFLEYGSPSWARTSDKRINSPLLYQLSYRGIVSLGSHLDRRRYATDLASIGQYLLCDYSGIYLIAVAIRVSAFSRLSISVA